MELRSLAFVLSLAIAAPLSARADAGCAYRLCPFHGQQPCSHECPEVVEWVPMPIEGGGGGDVAKPEDTKRTPPVDTGAVEYVGRVKKQVEDLQGKAAGREDAARKTRSSAQDLSRKI